MPTLNYFVRGARRELVPIYVRLSAGRKKDFIVPSGLTVNPQKWSNKTQTIKQRIRTDADEKSIKNLSDLKEYVYDQIRNFSGDYSKEWLSDIIDKYHNKKSVDATTLNSYIDRYIEESKTGIRHNKDALNLAAGTVRGWKCFKRVLNEFQGIYSPDRREWREKNKKPIRPKKLIDFDNVTIDFYNTFTKYLSDEGYNTGTIGRFIKELKFFMKKSLDDKLHNNREFEHAAFKVLKNDSFSVYLTKPELDKIYNIDLSGSPELDIARDAFVVLCETALRISDYKKVDLNIHTSEDGTRLIYITQTKTGGEIVIPCSDRLGEILKKYDNRLPRLPDQYINRRIKIIARMCGIDELQRWEVVKFGKRYEKTAYKWQMITCHSGRRTACSLMYLAGIPTLSIMQISGHKSEKVFLKYIKITPEENALKLASHPYFRNGLKVV